MTYVQQPRSGSIHQTTQMPNMSSFVPHSPLDARHTGPMPNEVFLDPLEPPEFQQPSIPDESSAFLGEPSFGDFLNNIMMPSNGGSFAAAGADMSYNPGRDMFDFGFDTDLGLTDLDAHLINSFHDPVGVSEPSHTLNAVFENRNGQPAAPQLTTAPTHDETVQALRDGSGNMELGIEAFRRSLWHYAPSPTDDGYSELTGLSLPQMDVRRSDMDGATTSGVLKAHLDQRTRDQVMGLFFGTCESSMIPRIVSSFPSVDVLDTLIHQCVAYHVTQQDPWLHIPSMNLTSLRTELSAVMIATGACLSSMPTVRRLGYAIQEAVRLAVPQSIEQDNSLTRELQTLQAYSLQLDIGLWSGNKRKMEIAESFAQPFVTMVRRAGGFRRPRERPIAPSNDDPADILEAKWRAWVEYESRKRLAIQIIINDAQRSMAFSIPPLISFDEVALDLPANLSLWLAQSAHTWRDAWLSNQTNSTPSLSQAVREPHVIIDARESIDTRMTSSLVLHRLWTLVCHCRQLSTAQQLLDLDHALVASSWHHELLTLLDNFGNAPAAASDQSSMKSENWPPIIEMLQQLLRVHLHVSFQDLQLFAGKEGADEGRRVFPSLSRWRESRMARQAVGHAGKILRAARHCRQKTLRDFHAVALYHAGMVLWAYGVLGATIANNNTRDLSQTIYPVFALDDHDTSETQRFIISARGIPGIRPCPNDASIDGALDSNLIEQSIVPLYNPSTVMNTIIAVLKGNHIRSTPIVTRPAQMDQASGDTSSRNASAGPSRPISASDESDEIPPLVRNLGQLMTDLGNAAGKVLGHRQT